jgi:hypothetical protein
LVLRKLLIPLMSLLSGVGLLVVGTGLIMSAYFGGRIDGPDGAWQLTALFCGRIDFDERVGLALHQSQAA